MDLPHAFLAKHYRWRPKHKLNPPTLRLITRKTGPLIDFDGSALLMVEVGFIATVDALETHLCGAY